MCLPEVYLISDALAPTPRLVALGALVLLVLLVTVLVVLRLRRAQARPAAGIEDHGIPGTTSAAPVAAAVPRLASALARTRAVVARNLGRVAHDAARAGWLEAVEESLIVADVGMATTQALLRTLERKLPLHCPAADALTALAGTLREVLAVATPAASEEVNHRPFVILVTGVNGVGKTTTIGKLAARYRRQGRSVLLVGADTFRAAAGEQLERWGERTSAAVIRQAPGADPSAVVVDGLRSAIARQVEVVIVDTAGRLHTRTNLMDELGKIRRVIGRECPGAPHETLLVLDASTGQNGLQQARLFRESVHLSGVVLTKLDGTAKGGIVVAVVAELGVPVRFVGLGEGPDDLQSFDAAEFVEALLPSAPEVDPGASPAHP